MAAARCMCLPALLLAVFLRVVCASAQATCVVDVFCYNGEPIVELRLQTLAPHVDRFYIVESRQTLSGIVKPGLYRDIHAHIFHPYAHKISWVILDNFNSVRRRFWFFGPSAWQREAMQRNAPVDLIQTEAIQSNCKCIMMVCDVDEIPRPKVVQALRRPITYALLSEPVALQMLYFYYNFDWAKNSKWTLPFAISAEAAVARKGDLDSMRLAQKKKAITNAGWHASYFEDVANIMRKVESFAHQELNKDSFKNHQHLAHCIQNGLDLFARGGKENMLPFNTAQLPEAFRKFNEVIKAKQFPGEYNQKGNGE